MAQQYKRQGKYSLILVIQEENGMIRRRTISSAIVEIAAAVFFVLTVAVTCKIVYDEITIRNTRKELVEQIVTINNLTDENEALAMENSTLTSKVTVLSGTVSQKAEIEDAITQETIENALPKGFPISGSSTMKEAEEGDPMLIFTASVGTNVLTSGTGTVVTVDSDEIYGTKIVIDHGNGYRSVYRNNGKALVKNGEELGKGYILFTVGEDNRELGYQILKDEQYIDPMVIIDING
ncbi:murein hydrolase activator EnvC [Lachnospiraceae bacterium]|nr:murein hydrolase activator EnvC [Lachnospiraceae bacterium]